jgi:hypothetical protein
MKRKYQHRKMKVINSININRRNINNQLAAQRNLPRSAGAESSGAASRSEKRMAAAWRKSMASVSAMAKIISMYRKCVA